jgi:two-component system, cell cycle response regulator DivK
MPRLLYVEDNEMNRDMLSRRLQRRGFEVLIAGDGEQGVAMAAAEKPNLILMDMRLPVLDGWQATRRLKSAPDTAGIPVICLTAHAMATDRGKCLEAGATTMTPSRSSSAGSWKRSSVCSAPARPRHDG